MDSIEVIPVNLGDRSYEIFVVTKMLTAIGETIQKKCGPRKILIVTDQDVKKKYLSPVSKSHCSMDSLSTLNNFSTL